MYLIMLQFQMYWIRMTSEYSYKKISHVHQGDLNGSWAEPTCAVGKERWGEEADGAIGESRISLAADEGQSHGHGNQGLQRVDGDGG